ncbi:MAG: hypothetical protein J7K40_13440 [candidate division Zixibacteria bacterium]|nr:hypothetical protein [candidate division Zixibacteria bacterium]
MERFVWFLDEIVGQFKAVENTLQSLMAKIPFIGSLAAEYCSLIMLVFMMTLAVFILRPLVKWSLMVIIVGAILAGAISYFSGLAFWGVLPVTALGATIVMFVNKFVME